MEGCQVSERGGTKRDKYTRKTRGDVPIGSLTSCQLVRPGRDEKRGLEVCAGGAYGAVMHAAGESLCRWQTGMRKERRDGAGGRGREMERVFYKK
jgi:hypothetical protein